MKINQFSIRRSTLRDIEILVSHRSKMWQEITKSSSSSSRHLRFDSDAYRNWLFKMIAERRYVGFVAVTDGGRIIGSGGLWLHEVPWYPRKESMKKKKLEEPYLFSMYTEPEYRGKGIGTSIVKEAMKWCKKKGYRSARLHASKMGMRLYFKLGWKKTSEMHVKI
jgi:GNAT superfamily N-acetyltransferase